MDMLDRIVAVLHALFGDGASPGRPRPTRTGSPGGASARPADPDLAAAWDELNDFLGADRGGTAGAGASGGARKGTTGDGQSWRDPAVPPEDLRADYANLEVPFGADIEVVRRSYKRLVLRYHPDRHAGDPEKLRVSTEITKKINESFERIRDFHERAGPRAR